MKTFLIAAGMLAAMIGAAPASAAPVGGNAPGFEAPAPQVREGYRDYRHHGRPGHRWDNRRDRRWRGNRVRCHNERHRGRWVRVCRRR